MSQHFPAILVVCPLLTALVVFAAGWIRPRLCFPLAALGLSFSALAAWSLAARVLWSGPVAYFLGGWRPPIGIAYLIDHLNAPVAAVVATAALINLAATRRQIADDFPKRLGAFYGLYLMAVTGLLGIVVTGDAFNLYVLLEIASLTGYALIGMGGGRASLAGLNYVLLGTIGACFYLLGVGYLYIVTGSLNMADIARLLPPLFKTQTVLIAFGLALGGMWLKMALFPLHGWLPNAYGFAPGPAASLLAPLATKVMIYVMLRMMITIFTPDYVFKHIHPGGFIVWLATAAIVAGGLFALMQRDLKRMLAYVVVSEVGYMVGGAWLGNPDGMAGAILHLINDAMMTLCLFLAVGNIAYRQGGAGFGNLQGLFRKMPWTMGGMVVGSLAVIGVPPTCGFFSKWYLIKGGIAAGHYGFVAALLFSSLVAVVLFFRVFEIALFEPLEAGHGGRGHGPTTLALAEAPVSMVAPLLITAAGLVAMGLSTGFLMNNFILPALPAGLGG